MISTTTQTNTFQPAPQNTSNEDLIRAFNTMLVSSRIKQTSHTEDLAQTLQSLIEKPAFIAILSAIQSFALEQQISVHEAAESMIQTFRNMEKTWGDYLLQEGANQLHIH